MILKAQKGRGSKIHILLDDEYQITTDISFWNMNFLPDGYDISEEEWIELTDKINYSKAFNKCADFLSRRNHSSKELKEKLLKTVDEKSAQKAIEKFEELGYIDDEKFAQEYTEHLFKTKNYSPSHVRAELSRKGISKDIANAVLQSFEYDPRETIIKIINKTYLRKLNDENGKEKVTAALMRKGFSYGDIKAAFYEIENE